MSKIPLKRPSFRTARFGKELQRHLSSLLIDHYALHISIARLVVSSDMRHIKIFLQKPFDVQSEQDSLRDVLFDLYIGRGNNIKQWSLLIETSNDLGETLLNILQILIPEIKVSIARNVRCRFVPELAFELDNTFYPLEIL